MRCPTRRKRPSGLISTCNRSPGRGHSYRCTGPAASGRRLSPSRRNQAPTVDRGMRSARAIAHAGSHAARGGRISDAAAASVRRRSGRDERPPGRGPLSRKRRTHFATVRTLTASLPPPRVAPPFEQYATHQVQARDRGGLRITMKLHPGPPLIELMCGNTILFRALRMNNVFSKDT